MKKSINTDDYEVLEGCFESDIWTGRTKLCGKGSAIKDDIWSTSYGELQE